jgi:hypothetical protein
MSISCRYIGFLCETYVIVCPLIRDHDVICQCYISTEKSMIKRLCFIGQHQGHLGTASVAVPNWAIKSWCHLLW